MIPESESNFRALVENAHDGIVILANDGGACFANKRACEICGCNKSELSIIDFKTAADGDFYNKAVQMCQTKITDGQVPGFIETRLAHKRGQELNIELSVSWTVWDGKPAVLVIFRDISNRKCVEEALSNTCAEQNCLICKRELELNKRFRESERIQKELSQLKIEGEKINNELLETNNAFSILASNINKHRLKAEKNVAGTINSKIMPIIKTLRKKAKLDDVKDSLDILDAHLQTLAKELMGEMNTLGKLTPTEMQIATMIKNGLKSREIAERFYISLQTVKTHRRNIRKKLNIQVPSASLTSYLRSVMA